MKWFASSRISLALAGFVTSIMLCGGRRAKADFTFGTPAPLPNGSLLGGNAWASSISSDGLSLYFTITASGGDRDIWVTTRATTDEPWGPPANLGPTVNSPAYEMKPSISSDSLSLYFCDGLWDIQRPRPGGFGGGDLWVTTRPTLDSVWGPPINLGSLVNSSATEGGPSISSDGLSLFFACVRPGASGSDDIWMTSRATPDSEWGLPLSLGPVVNSPARDVHPDISADGTALFFQSDRSGMHDLWVSIRATLSDPFGPPVHIGPMIKTSWRLFPNISTDGRMLFFTVPSWTVWQVPIVPIVDFNGDGIVDATDMCIMIDGWGENYPLCDIGPMFWGDGIVNVQDLVVLAEHLFEDVNDPTLVAHWPLDEAQGIIAYDNAVDCDGTLMGGPVWQPEGGTAAGALQFDGIDDYVSTDPVLNPADGKFSVVAWVKGGAPGQAVISQADGSNWLRMDCIEGCLMTELTNPGRSILGPLSSQANVTDGEWHRIGFVWDGSYRHLYVDGSEVAIDAAPLSELVSAEGGLYFGAGSALSPGTFFCGLIDDIRIYNRAISP